MKALILVGGFGTRLRPLTLSKPKPLVEFCNVPILEHQIAALADVGVTEIVLAVSYRPEDMKEALKSMEERYRVRIVFSVEDEPLGTAGPLALARSHLAADGEVFFVFNSDVTCEYPLRDLLAFHHKHGCEGSICVTRVAEPSKYGVVVHGTEAGAGIGGKIEHFVEKPQTFVGNHINAGLYCFSPSILNRLPADPATTPGAPPLKPISIEKEIFPLMAEQGQLWAFCLQGFWMDIGQPRDFLTGQGLHLAAMRKHSPEKLAPSGEGIKGNVLIDSTATVGKGCVLGPDVVVGPGCVVEDGCRLVNCCLLKGTRVQSHALVSGSIIGWSSTLGRWSRVEAGAVLGEDVAVADEKTIHGAIILPHKSLKESYLKAGEIVM